MTQTNGSIAVIERAIKGVRSEATREEGPASHSLVPSDTSMPDYVEHRDGVTEIGKLSAEAIVREYEATAKEIESMGADMIERAKACEDVTRDTLAVTKELNEIADRYRKEAKRVFEHIENCSALVAAARLTCDELKDKIAAPMKSNRPK
jgi:hypothetical protein